MRVLEVGNAAHPIGHARSALVEDDHAARTRRARDAYAATFGLSQPSSTCDTEPGTMDDVERPVSDTWYAMRRRRSSCSASRVARGVVSRSPSCTAAYAAPRWSRDGSAIIGAAGRDFHNFNVLFRGSTHTRSWRSRRRRSRTSTAASIRPSWRGPLSERDPDPARGGARQLIRADDVDEAVFSYSDVSHEHVMHVASRALAAGADFRCSAPRTPSSARRSACVAVCAVRTGAGKSQTSRRVAEILRGGGHRVAVLRHPMPYGDLTKQAVQRFETYEDLEAADCTIEEREEYEPHLDEGNLVFAGVDYARSSSRRSRRRTSSSGRAATTTRRSSAPTFSSSWSTLIAPATSSLPPGGDEPADGRRLHRQQGGLAPEGASTPCSRRSRASTRAIVVRAASPIEVEGGGEAITASASSASRTGRP